MAKEQKDCKTPIKEPTKGATAPEESGPKLMEVDDTVSGRFDPQPTGEIWVPGVIEVEFKDATRSGVLTWDFSQSKEQREYSEAWPASLKELLISNNLLKWKPSFPLRYPWSHEDSEESARKFYAASGRDRFVTFYFPNRANVLNIARELTELPDLAHAVPVPQLAPPSTPLGEPLMGTSDQLMNTICRSKGCLENQWYIFRCRVNKAWEKASGKGVVIADIDWGFNLNHRDLRSRIALKKNTSDNSTSVSNGNRFDHGTAVLGLAGAEVNSLGMAGIAYEAFLWAIQAGDDTIMDPAFWVSAIDFVRSEKSDHRKVIILEIQTKKRGNVEMGLTINKAIIDAIHDNVVVCVPAGNGSGDAGIGDDGKPIPPTGSILVGATKYDPQANIRSGSKGGSRIVVYAPGDEAHDLTCSVPGEEDYRNHFGGTSGAVAKVAGTVALMLEVNNKLTNKDICDILKQSEIPVIENSSKQVGVLLNAEQAVCEALKRVSQSES
jgi:subtilisin family serine protease